MIRKQPIYLDYHATTPLDPEVLAAMLPYLKDDFGNAASQQHIFGLKAQAAVKKARKDIAQCLGSEESEIIFTSGATESNNLAILGLAQRFEGKHFITTAVEHKSVLDPHKFLTSRGFKVTILPVDSCGKVSVAEFKQAITPDTVLISVIAANNEIGTLNPIAEIGELASLAKITFHVDGAQAVGKVPIDVEKMKIDLLSFTAHKFYGPKGCGGLYVRKRPHAVKLNPLFYGGGHEAGLRSGTLNVPAIVGMAKAMQKACQLRAEEAKRLIKLRERLYQGICSGLDEVYLNGHSTDRLPGNLNLSFVGVKSNALMMAMPEIAVSSGSACSSANPEPSHVLKALGFSPERAESAIRFGLGRLTTETEIDYTIKRVIEVVKKLRENGAVIVRI